MTRTANTHDRGALFGYDGQAMWIEQTLDTAPDLTCYASPDDSARACLGYQCPHLAVRGIDQ